MKTYAIGDIHGCFSMLEGLLGRLDFDKETDRLWLVGDLVNRGPGSLETLRWARQTADQLGDRFTVVLGNHDLYLVAIHRGWARQRKKDTLAEILAAPDCAELVEWLAARPVLHREGDTLLVHAGLLPHWTAAQAELWARRVDEGLASRGLARELLARADRGADVSDPAWRALGAFTRLRTLTPDSDFCDYTGPPADTPTGCMPWFARPDRRTREQTIIAGHWAAAGLRLETGLVALDSGAVYGGSLSAIRLEDRAVFQEPNRGAH